jgi:hypothetical protein
MKNLLLTAVLALTLASCGTTYTASNLPDKQILFGEGGGFTGNVKEYILLENGQLFTRTTFAGEATELPKVKKKTAESYFLKLEELKDMSYIKPGNKYTYVQYQVDSSTNYRVVWKDGDENAPESAQMYFEELKGLVKPPKDKN